MTLRKIIFWGKSKWSG